MILVTLANLVLLVFTAGLIGPYIFPALLLCAGINYKVLLFFCTAVEESSEATVEQDPEDGLRDDQSKSLRNAAEETQSFIALAALSSIWLPCVVGHQPMRIFLFSGVTSLTSKVLLLALALAFSGSGLQAQIYKRPFLLFCFEENSTRLAEADISETVMPCSVLEGNCQPSQNMTHEKRFLKALEQLESALEEYDNTVNSIDNSLKTEGREGSDLFHQKLNSTSTILAEIKHQKGEVEEKLHPFDVRNVQQKIRICEKSDVEMKFRLGVLFGLLVLIALAAYSTYKLHKIADYQVSKFINDYPE